MGSKVSAVDYLRAREFREKFKAFLEETLLTNNIDAVVVPTTPIPAPRIGEDSINLTISVDGLSATKSLPVRSLLLRLCRPANLAGVPAISVPCGLSRSGLPIGLQFIASWTDEPLLLELASYFEQVCPLSSRRNLL